MQTAPSVHPMIAAAQRLTGDRVRRGPALAGVAGQIVADTQMGAAYHEGELVLAALHYEFPSRGRAQGSHASLVVTDRRIYGSVSASNISASVMDLPLATVTAVTEDSGLITNAAVVTTTSGSVRFPMMGKEIAGYLRAVLAVPPEHRTLGPLVIAPEPGDPVGAHSATALMGSGNPAVLALPRLAFEAGRQGKLAEAAARALLERAVIQDRVAVTGRGMHQGQWLTTLPRPTLAALLGAMLGAPLASSGDAGWERHDFGMTPGGRSAGAAAASTALGLASAALLGVGWVSRPGGGLGFSVLRATIVDFPCGAGFQLAAVQGAHAFRLPFAASGLIQAMFETVARVELRRLLAEVAIGAAAPPQQLASIPCQQLEAAVAALGAPLHLTALYPK